MTQTSSVMYDEATICSMSVAELGAAYRDGSLSALAACQAVLARIERLDPHVHAFISVSSERALREAQAADDLFRSGVDLGPLQGIPYSVKDCLRAQGTRTTAASRLLADAPCDERDSEVVARLADAGAVLIGKNNLYEFVFAEPGPDDLFPETANPRRSGRRAGGSSSGSAAAVAAGFGAFSIGTDTGGSVRHPANLCGVAGYVAASGDISNDGTIPVSEQLDRVGILARSCEDVALVADIISARSPVSNGAVGLTGIRVGIGGNEVFSIGAADALVAYRAMPAVLESLGVSCPDIDVPQAEVANGAADTIMTADAVHHHERYADRAHLYGRNFVARTQPGRELLAVDYLRACATRDRIRSEWATLFADLDVLVLPGNMIGAPSSDQYEVEVGSNRYLVRSVTSPATRCSSLTGYPSLVLPVAESAEGLPIGVQLVARPGAETELFSLAAAIEASTGNLTRKWGINPDM